MPGRKLAFVAIVFATMIPFQVMLAPIFRQVNAFGLINTYPGIILPCLAFGVPHQVFILHGFFSAVPKELQRSRGSTTRAISPSSAGSFCPSLCLPCRRCSSLIL